MTRVPFFITGSGRSGSTYLYHLLRAHPKIAITNEARIIDALFLAYQVVSIPYGRSVPNTKVVGVVDEKVAPMVEDVFRGHLMNILEESYTRGFTNDFTHFGDKLPDYSAVAMAAQWSPSIKTILMVRDPRDVVCSYRAVQRHAVPIGEREVRLLGYSVADLARVWTETYEHLLREVPRMHHVSYADLVARPALTVAAVLDFLGLPQDPAVAKAIAENDTLAKHGTSKSVGDSLGRWRRDLAPEEARLVESISGPMMTRLGLRC